MKSRNPTSSSAPGRNIRSVAEIGGGLGVSLLVATKGNRPGLQGLANPCPLGACQRKGAGQLDELGHANIISELTQCSPRGMAAVSRLGQCSGYPPGCPIATHLGGGKERSFYSHPSGQAQDDEVDERTDHDTKVTASISRPTLKIDHWQACSGGNSDDGHQHRHDGAQLDSDDLRRHYPHQWRSDQAGAHADQRPSGHILGPLPGDGKTLSNGLPERPVGDVAGDEPGRQRPAEDLGPRAGVGGQATQT